MTGHKPDLPVLMIGSHIDTVPDAGKYDGVLGVMLGIAAVQASGGDGCRSPSTWWRSPTRKGCATASPSWAAWRPAAGSTPVCWIAPTPMASRWPTPSAAFGLDPSRIGRGRAIRRAAFSAISRLTSSRGRCWRRWRQPVGVVEAIAGQSRLWIEFTAGRDTPGPCRWKAGATRWRRPRRSSWRSSGSAARPPGLRATVGTIAVEPGAVNVVPGAVQLSVDIRHAATRSGRGGGRVPLPRPTRPRHVAEWNSSSHREDHHAAVPADPRLDRAAQPGRRAAGHAPHRLDQRRRARRGGHGRDSPDGHAVPAYRPAASATTPTSAC